MKFLEILRKLGILRGGMVSGVYKSYKEMPDELMYNNVYDKNKDLVDLNKKSASISRKTDSKLVAILFWIFFVITILVIIVLLLVMGFKFWFLVSLIFWLFFIWKLRQYKKGFIGLGRVLIFFLIIFIISVVFLFISVPGKDSNQRKATQNSDCHILAERYNGKVFKISSNQAIKGQIGFKIDQQTCAYDIVWQTLFNAQKIIKNLPDANSPVASYNYTADIVFNDNSPHPADGTISPVFANKDLLPADPFNYRVPFTFYATPGIVAGTDKNADTNTFYHTMQQSGTFSEATIQATLGVKKINIYSNDKYTQTVKGAAIVDQDAAVRGGSLVAEYDVNVSEK